MLIKRDNCILPLFGLSLLLLIFLSALSALAQDIEIKEIESNNMVFKCRIAGDPNDEPVILLHGWPETSHMWTSLMKKLSAEGYFCIAPDQRGFSTGARPKKTKNYHIDFLVEDIVSLATELDINDFHLIGHDWGSAIGWAVIAKHPDRLKSWTALSVPHIKAFSDAIRDNEEQAEMSKYMKQIQIKGIPEWILLRKDREKLREAWSNSSSEELEDYLNVIGNKSALKASLAYYRANYNILKKGKGISEFGETKVPTIFIWGSEDIAVSRFAAEETAQYMKGTYQFIELKVGHWLIQEAFEECYSNIRNHLQKNK